MQTLDKKQKAVAIWLIAGVLMLIIQVMLGGITRLTGSGLSIAEWKPILGAVPPLNTEDWQKAFDLYKEKASGQFNYHNSDYTLSDFKAIYFWEWMHREWARLIGIVFLIGFAVFWKKKYLSKDMLTPFLILFLLGILQGTIGWIMVMSGLNPDDTHVSHIKLALHFIFALLLLAYVLWFALQLIIKKQNRLNSQYLRSFTLALLVLLSLQLCYGAFMAGLRAASAAATWPSINGFYIPDTSVNSYGNEIYHGLRLLTDHPVWVHFIHRNLGYAIAILITVWLISVLKATRREQKPLLKKTALLSFGFVLLQVGLGIFTVLNGHKMALNKFGSFEILAESHQMVAIFLLLSLLVSYYLVAQYKENPE